MVNGRPITRLKHRGRRWRARSPLVTSGTITRLSGLLVFLLISVGFGVASMALSLLVIRRRSYFLISKLLSRVRLRVFIAFLIRLVPTRRVMVPRLLLLSRFSSSRISLGVRARLASRMVLLVGILILEVISLRAIGR